MKVVILILIIINIILLIYSFKKYKINNKIKEENKRQLEFNKELENKESKLHSQIKALEEIAEIEKKHILEYQKSYKDNLSLAYENYCDVLDSQYKDKEEEYSILIQKLENSYENIQVNYLNDINQIKNELIKIKNTRAATIEAQLKEKEIKDNKDFYSIQLDDFTKQDIEILNKMKTKLHTPRILSMLIWSTYIRDKMNILCNNILGTSLVTGIYKVTNLTNNMCYIGQAVDVGKRWKDHAKCGLDIDRPQGNKLYQAMIEYGLWNFTFELLEECPREQLNEKEKFYIELYQSNDYGYNGNKRNTKIENVDY